MKIKFIRNYKNNKKVTFPYNMGMLNLKIYLQFRKWKKKLNN
jgi:hypothetical protein